MSCRLETQAFIHNLSEYIFSNQCMDVLKGYYTSVSLTIVDLLVIFVNQVNVLNIRCNVNACMSSNCDYHPVGGIKYSSRLCDYHPVEGTKSSSSLCCHHPVEGNPQFQEALWLSSCWRESRVPAGSVIITLLKGPRVPAGSVIINLLNRDP